MFILGYGSSLGGYDCPLVEYGGSLGGNCVFIGIGHDGSLGEGGYDCSLGGYDCSLGEYDCSLAGYYTDTIRWGDMTVYWGYMTVGGFRSRQGK